MCLSVMRSESPILGSRSVHPIEGKSVIVFKRFIRWALIWLLDLQGPLKLDLQ